MIIYYFTSHVISFYEIILTLKSSAERTYIHISNCDDDDNDGDDD